MAEDDSGLVSGKRNPTRVILLHSLSPFWGKKYWIGIKKDTSCHSTVLHSGIVVVVHLFSWRAFWVMLKWKTYHRRCHIKKWNWFSHVILARLFSKDPDSNEEKYYSTLKYDKQKTPGLGTPGSKYSLWPSMLAAPQSHLGHTGSVCKFTVTIPFIEHTHTCKNPGLRTLDTYISYLLLYKKLSPKFSSLKKKTQQTTKLKPVSYYPKVFWVSDSGAA